MNSEGFRETFLRSDREGPKKAKMAGKKEAKQKAGPSGQTEKNREETGSSTGTKNTSEEGGQRTAQSMQRKVPQRKEAQKDFKGQGESKKPSMTKRRQARKVATMVKRLKKNPEDVEQQPLAEAGAGLAPGDGWDAQQQATVAAYAQSRGMRPREVLQALVNSMEKTLRKEKGENLASQTSLLSAKQQGEAASKAEARPNPGRGGRDLRERKTDSNCVACCKDKKKGVPPKTRWKEEQKEKARNQEAQGKENRTVVVPGPGRIIAATGSEGSEARQVPEEAQKDTAAIPGPEEVTATAGSEGGETRQTPEGVQESTKDPKKEDAQAQVACVTGVPRGPVSRGELARVALPGDRSSPEAMEEINLQYLHSKYNFKEGAPLKEYLRQRIPNFRETCTLSEVLTWLKEIIRDNLLFDEGNPAVIVGDAPLEAALRKKRVHVNEIRSVVQRQLTIVEARQGPMSAAMLAEGLAQMGSVSFIPRPAVRAVAAPNSTPSVRVVSLTEVPAGPVVLYSPVPGISQDIGTVSYTPPPCPAAGQNAGGAAATATSTGANFTGVRVRPLIRAPGTSRGPPLSREAAASISQVIVTLTLLLANAGSTNGFMAYSCEDMRSPMIGYELTPQAGC